MLVQRHIASWSLLTAILIGGLLSPVAHFAYMAMGDAHMSGDAMEHAAHAPDMAALDGDGSEAFHCEYQDLFATQSLADDVVDFSHAGDLAEMGCTIAAGSTVWATERTSQNGVRGPPVA